MSNRLADLVPTATRRGPVALIEDPDALEALGRHPDAPRPDLHDRAFLDYMKARRGYSFADGARWSDITVHTRGRLVDCWDLYRDKIGRPLETAVDWSERKNKLFATIFD